ncbi:hypothetical protein [Dactylosporangium sp. NPDC049140]|uniref:hypothetical protein n=1 Tax=Dactylosporangium sp. NPDC049140 TaxID=3155647 RepID=UPI0034112457
MVTLVTAALVAAVFLRAAAGFVRGRDPLRRDVALIFLPTLAVCANAVFRDLSHRRLAGRLGRVPRRLNRTLLVLMLGRRRHVHVVHDTTGTDAVLLLGHDLERIASVCRSGTRLPHERLEFDVPALLAARQPVRLPKDHPLALAPFPTNPMQPPIW